MKKLTLSLASVLLLTTLSVTSVKAESKPLTPNTTSTAQSAHVNAMLARLNEIKAMDKSTLSRSEKRELRKEVQSTKEALRRDGYNGFYISGAAVIIIILLILLL
jgi:hypothetical protein